MDKADVPWRHEGEMLLHKAPQAQEYLPFQNKPEGNENNM